MTGINNTGINTSTEFPQRRSSKEVKQTEAKIDIAQVAIEGVKDPRVKRELTTPLPSQANDNTLDTTIFIHPVKSSIKDSQKKRLSKEFKQPEADDEIKENPDTKITIHPVKKKLKPSLNDSLSRFNQMEAVRAARSEQEEILKATRLNQTQLTEDLYVALSPYYTTTDFKQVLSHKVSTMIFADYYGFSLAQHAVFISKSEKGIFRFGIVDLSKKAFAKGGFGKIHHVDNPSLKVVLKLSRKRIKGNKPLTNEEREVAKRDGTFLGNQAAKDIRDEFSMMHFLKKNLQDTTGLNTDALCNIEFQNQSGFFLKKYDFNASKYIAMNPPPQSIFTVISQLKTGLESLHSLNIVHRDIKIENTLFSRVEKMIVNLGDGNSWPCYKAVLSDFGNACKYSTIFNDPLSQTKGLLGFGTRRTTSKFLKTQIEKALIGIEKLNREDKEYKKRIRLIFDLLKDSDRFSLGVLFYTLCTGMAPPFQSFENKDYFAFDQGMRSNKKTAFLEGLEFQLQRATRSCPDFEKKKISTYIIDLLKLGLDLS